MAAAALLALAALGNTGPLGRYAHCAVRLHDAMYIYGGRGFARSGRRELVLFSDMWVFSVETIAWDRVVFTGSEAGLPMPGPRSSHACAAADDKTMYLFGGMAESVGGEPELADDLWRFELSSRLEGVWRRIKPVGGGARPTPRSDHALLATSTDTLFLAGGCDSRVAQPDAWRFSLSSSRWELVPFDDDGDDAARRLGGEGVVAGAADGGDGASAQEGTELEVGAAAAGRARSRGLAEDAAVGALANDTLGNGTADNQTDGGAVVLPPTRLPGARCAHTASATAEPSSSGVADLILFGGRISVSAQAQDDGGRCAPAGRLRARRRAAATCYRADCCAASSELSCSATARFRSAARSPPPLPGRPAPPPRLAGPRRSGARSATPGGCARARFRATCAQTSTPARRSRPPSRSGRSSPLSIARAMAAAAAVTAAEATTRMGRRRLC